MPLGEGAAPGSCGDLVADGQNLLCVRESADGDALVQLDAAGVETILVRDEFLASPAPHPDGRRLAWLRWDSTQMPWDATQLKVAERTPDGNVGTPVHVAGGDNESVLEPQWGPDGDLYFVSDRSGWWNLYRWDGETTHDVIRVAAECAAAPWELGYHSYAFLPDGQIAFLLRQGSTVRLTVARAGREIQVLDLPFTSLKPSLAIFGGRIAVIAASQAEAAGVILVDPATPETYEVLTSGFKSVDRPLSVAQRLTVPGAQGGELHVLLYPPTGPNPIEEDWSAPLIVKPHPGPTDQTNERLDWRTQFFASHGFAVAEVDYRGSTGYGRAFRESLYGHWGEYDVADCEAVARHLLAAGRTQPGKVFVSGASAGAYTALKAVSAPDTAFSAAVAGMSIVDPVRWAEGVARFQRAHAQRLAGPAGSVVAEEIRRPVLLLHGAKDHVAPLRDAEQLAADLRARGNEVDLRVFAQAGHSFSAGPVAAAVLEAELALFRGMLAD
jgi:dipeptidyl aminopeptidase/acylaminoacyl peptidase